MKYNLVKIYSLEEQYIVKWVGRKLRLAYKAIFRSFAKSSDYITFNPDVLIVSPSLMRVAKQLGLNL